MTYTKPIPRPGPTPRVQMTPEEREQIAEMYKAGEKVEVIAMTFRRTVATIRKVARAAGIPVRTPGWQGQGKPHARNT